MDKTGIEYANLTSLSVPLKVANMIKDTGSPVSLPMGNVHSSTCDAGTQTARSAYTTACAHAHVSAHVHKQADAYMLTQAETPGAAPFPGQ